MTRPNSVEIGRPRLADHELDRLEERGAGAQRVGDQGDRVRQLLVEGVEAARLAAVQPEAREHEPDERADEQHDRVAQRREDDRERATITTGTPIVVPAQIMRYSLSLSFRSARAISRARLAPKSRCSTTLLSWASAWLDWNAAPKAAVAGRAGGRLVRLGGGVALEPGVDAGPAAGHRDADRDQQDREGRDAGDEDGHGPRVQSSVPTR